MGHTFRMESDNGLDCIELPAFVCFENNVRRLFPRRVVDVDVGMHQQFFCDKFFSFVTSKLSWTQTVSVLCVWVNDEVDDVQSNVVQIVIQTKLQNRVSEFGASVWICTCVQQIIRQSDISACPEIGCQLIKIN